MAKWFVKDLSKITGVSVQTLHHYDRIGLFRPSLRQANGYRLYSEKDLIRLQQIIALKFFGFKLCQITKLLSGDVDMMEHLSVQAKFLAEKAATLNSASQKLSSIISDYQANESIPWENVIKLIEVYYMTQQLENSWIANALTPEELKQYAEFDAGLKQRFTLEEKKQWEIAWGNAMKELTSSLNTDPKGPKGMELAKKVMDLVNQLYGKEYANLKNSIWKKGFKEGHATDEHVMTPEVVAWLDKAVDHYYRSRIYFILDKAATHPAPSVLKSWNDLLEEMYGNSNKLKQELIEVALKDDRVDARAKKWLQQV